LYSLGSHSRNLSFERKRLNVMQTKFCRDIAGREMNSNSNKFAGIQNAFRVERFFDDPMQSAHFR